VNILHALDDRNVFGPHFRGETWKAWRAFFAALFGLAMTDEQTMIYKQHTGRSTPPSAPCNEAWLVIGRRGGKSFALATVAVFLACFKDWRYHLGPGELATIMVIARDRRQARVIKRFISGLLRAVPMLAATIGEEAAESITLKCRVQIEIHTASFRSTRGYTIVAALLDELAFWPTDETSAEPDVEVINAVRPGMATIPDAMLLCASSPHARRGALWDAYRKHHGKDGDPVLCWQATTRQMNPSVPQSFIDSHMADDPARGAAEYLAHFRTDLEAFVAREAVAACIADGVYERGFLRQHSYVAFVDPSGGRSDSMTLCIAHNEPRRQVVVIDCVREIPPPFSPEAVVAQFAATLKTYRLRTCTGDRFAGEWPVEQFSKFGIRYEPAPKPKSDLYVDLLPLINSRRIDLLDNAKLLGQLCGLERRTARGGRDSIDHAPGSHDDLANAVAGAAVLAVGRSTLLPYRQWVDGAYSDDPLGIDAWRRMRLQAYLLSGGTVRL
jgi:hypothetical protein